MSTDHDHAPHDGAPQGECFGCLQTEQTPEVYDAQAEEDAAYCDIHGFAHQGGQCS